MPLVRSRVATVSEGWAPCSSQCFARSSSMLIVEGSVCGLYWPIVSIVRPSRGERLSATTIRQIGFFLEPTRLSLIRTAIRTGQVTGLCPACPDAKRRTCRLTSVSAPAHLRARRAPAPYLGPLLLFGPLARAPRAHHLANLAELFSQIPNFL